MEKRSYSKTGDWEVLSRIQSERVMILRNGELSLRNLQKIKHKIQPWLDAGIVSREEAVDCENPPEKELHYSITKIGEEFLLDYKHYGFY